MLKVSRWRLFFTIVATAAAVYAVLSIPIQLGLDLRGGTQIVLEAQDTPEVTVDAEVTTRTLEVLRRRVDAFGVAEPTLQLSGDRRIIIELPGLKQDGLAATKDAGLAVSDRIRLAIGGDADVQSAVSAHREWIAGEVLATELLAQPGSFHDSTFSQVADLDGIEVAISLTRME